MASIQKNLFFTFDYELYLGEKSGGVDKCVLEPTQKLLDIFNPYKIKAIFFVDLTWLLKLKEISKAYPIAQQDYINVTRQIQEIYKRGHYIFPHLHPHWEDGYYIPETNQWRLIRYVTFRLHYLAKEEQEILFEKSVSLLKEILGNDYTPVGYRAGGWSIQPFDDFKPLFKKYGIKYDFSVLPGDKYFSNGPHYDFSTITIEEPYTFSEDLTPSNKGEFVEFPISLIKVTKSKKLQNRVLLKYLQLKGR